MMEFTGERYTPSLTGEIYYEHVHRYAIAAPACAGKRVLDLASGEGWGAAFLARQAAEVVGVDIDVASIEHARRAYYLANLRFVTASATDIPLPDASVDVITSFETIEHLSDHDRMLDEFRRVLVPGGTLFISSPNKLVYSDLSNYHNPFHVRELYYQEFRDLLKRRFANVEIYGQRFVSSSILHPLSGLRSDDAGWYAGDLSAIGDGLPTLSAPVYFVAVCSDGALYDRIASGFVDPRDDLYAHLRHEMEVLRGRLALDQPLMSSQQEDSALAAASRYALSGGTAHRSDALPHRASADDAASMRVLQEELLAACARADEAKALTQAAEAAVGAERTRADEAEVRAQAAAASLHDLKEALVAEHAWAEEAEALRHAAEDGLAAERERADHAEARAQAAADASRELEKALVAERARADEAETCARAGADALAAAAAEYESVIASEREHKARLEIEGASQREAALKAGELAARFSGETAARRKSETQLAELRAEFESLAAAREALKDEVESYAARGRELEQELSALHDEIGKRDDALAARNATLAELQLALDERTAEIARHDYLIAARDAASTALERDLANLRDEVTERDDALAARDARLAELKRVLDDRTAELARRDALIAARDAAIAEADALVREREGWIADRDTRIADFERSLAEQATRMAALTAMAAERDAMEARIIELEARLAQEHAASAIFRDNAERDGRLLREMLSSRSWRMTAMLRGAARVMRGRRPS